MNLAETARRLLEATAANHNAAPVARSSTPARANRRAPARRTHVRLEIAGFTFTYCPRDAGARVRIDMWREDPITAKRHWITVATTSPDPDAARAVALALVTWVRSLGVGPKNSIEAQAVAESLAVTQARLAMLAPGTRSRVLARPTQVGRPNVRVLRTAA